MIRRGCRGHLVLTSDQVLYPICKGSTTISGTIPALLVTFESKPPVATLSF